jgi:F-type H+-transporting ATPase subunit c
MKKQFAVAAATLLAISPACAQDAAAHAAGMTDKGIYALGAALALGLAALGGALAQGKLGASAMEGLARNPQARSAIFVPMIIGLVFIETLVLFTFALSFTVQGYIK